MAGKGKDLTHIAAGRTMRIVRRRYYKKSMKNLLRLYREQAGSAYVQGKSDVAEAAHRLSYD